ncbi:MAG: transposase [Proteobacteria bacterium]|nr:transposase [Pseudomonadota bacterium]
MEIKIGAGKLKDLRRRSVRLKGYDYSGTGAYFVTVCTNRKKCILGKVIDEQIVPTTIGKIAKNCWEEIPKHFPNVELDEFVIMPNHVHGIIQIIRVGATHASPLQKHLSNSNPHGSGPRTIGSIVGSLKSATTRYANGIGLGNGFSIWQRNYYEHIIRNEDELNQVREYIIKNPLKWQFDRENPDHKGDACVAPTIGNMIYGSTKQKAMS